MLDKQTYTELSEVLKAGQKDVLKLWVKQINETGSRINTIYGEEELKRSCSDMQNEFIKALATGIDVDSDPYSIIRKSLEKLSETAAFKGLTPSETAIFIFSLKDGILPLIQTKFEGEKLIDIIGMVNRLIDRLGLITLEAFVNTKEKLVKEQSKAILELSSPVVKVWDKILMVSLIGMLDSARTQQVMETLLTEIEESQSKVAILDISGIPTVDSLVAKHLLKTVSATKLMGAECIITGINSRISQTMVQLGIDLTGVITKSTMADGLYVAFSMTNLKVVSK